MVLMPQSSKIRPTAKTYSFETYLLRESTAVEKHEFYNGKIVKMPGGTDTHSEIAMNIGTAIKVAVRPFAPMYRVYSSDLKIYIEPANIAVYGDVLIVCKEPIYWNQRRDVIINPLLVVEVLSPATQAYDRLGKFEFYKMLPSFQEYVLIHADKGEVETRFREAPDLWRDRIETNMQEFIPLRSLNVSISMADIYENITFPPPKTRQKKKLN